MEGTTVRLKTAPALFAQAISKMLGPDYEDSEVRAVYGSTELYAVAYVDDIIIFSEEEEKHVDHVGDVLRRIRTFGFKIAIEKCKWFKPEVKYLGHIISKGIIKMNPEKGAIIRSYERPKTKAGLVSFMR